MELFDFLVSPRKLADRVFGHLSELGDVLGAMENGHGEMVPISKSSGLPFTPPGIVILQPRIADRYTAFPDELELRRFCGPESYHPVSVFGPRYGTNINSLRLSGPEVFGEVIPRAEGIRLLAEKAQLTGPNRAVLLRVAEVDHALMRRLRASFYGYTGKIEEHFLGGVLQLAVFGRPTPEILFTKDVLDSEASFNAFMNQEGFLPVPDEFDLKVPRNVPPGRSPLMIAHDVTRVIEPNTNLHRGAHFLANRADLAKAGRLKDLVAANAKLDESARAAYEFATQVTGAAVEASSGGRGRLRRFTASLKRLDLSRYGSLAGVLLSIGLLAFSLNASASENNEPESDKSNQNGLSSLVHNPLARGLFGLAFPKLDLALSLV